jgi:hypothetical protein
MLVLGIIFSIFGLGVLLSLLFTLAVYALPFFVAVTAGMAAFHSGAGVIGAILVAAFAGGATLVIGQIVFAMVRSPAIRATVAFLYAVPATIAGYRPRQLSDRVFRCLRPRRGFRTAPGCNKHAVFDERLLIGTLSGHF